MFGKILIQSLLSHFTRDKYELLLSYSNITHNCLDTSMLNDNITLQEIERVLAQAPSRKSFGPDNIYADYFKNPKLFSIITSLFRLCFQSSDFPKLW